MWIFVPNKADGVVEELRSHTHTHSGASLGSLFYFPLWVSSLLCVFSATKAQKVATERDRRTENRKKDESQVSRKR